MFAPEFYTRFIALTTFTLAFGITGFVFILAFIDNKSTSGFSANIGTGISTGVIVVILFVIGLSALHIPTTKANLSIAFLGFYTISLYRLRKKFTPLKFQPANWTRLEILKEIPPAVIFLVILTLRTAQINVALVPNWLDGLFHASMLNNFLMIAGIPLDSIYHVGFHAIGLTVYYFWGLNLPETILVLGQWLSAVSGLTFYYLARQYTRNTYIACLSFVIYSLFLLFPSYLTSWGRYPFLLGLTLLPFAITTGLNWITNRNGSYLAAAIFITGLALSHYSCLLIWFSFIGVYWGSRLTLERKAYTNRSSYYLRYFLRLLLLIPPLVLVVLPKIINLINHPSIISDRIIRAHDPDFEFEAQYLLGQLFSHDYFFFFIWMILVLWFVARKRWLIHIIVSWPVLILFFIWIQFRTMGFSFSSYINLIVFFAIPLSLSFGFFVQGLLLSLKYMNTLYSLHFSKNLFHASLSILLVVILIWGVYIAPHSISIDRMLFTNDDRLAMNWINNNTSASAGFLIRTTIWDAKELIPSDGGGWIEYFTGRKTLIPEIGEIYDLCEYSRLNGADYIYLGKQSIIDNFDFRLDELPNHSYKVVYRNQSVAIIQLRCP